MSGKFELFRDKRGEYRFRLKAGNGEILLASDAYKEKSGALNGIASVQKNAEARHRFRGQLSLHDKPYFVLTAANGQMIGTSEIFSSEHAKDNAIKSVMYSAPSANIEDQT